jgi:hypothetical protein
MGTIVDNHMGGGSCGGGGVGDGRGGLMQPSGRMMGKRANSRYAVMQASAPQPSGRA